MKFEDIEKVLHAKTTDIIGLKTVISLSPLDHFDVYQLPPTKVGGLSLISMWSNRRIFLPHSLLFTTK